MYSLLGVQDGRYSILGVQEGIIYLGCREVQSNSDAGRYSLLGVQEGTVYLGCKRYEYEVEATGLRQGTVYLSLKTGYTSLKGPSQTIYFRVNSEF